MMQQQGFISLYSSLAVGMEVTVNSPTFPTANSVFIGFAEPSGS